MTEKQDLAQLRGIVATGTPLAATTVLALLDRIKYLEGQTRRNYQDWQIAHGRAEAAEKTVARVREVAETSTDKFLTMALFEALDGDPQ